MPRPALRTRSRKRKQHSLPGGRKRVHSDSKRSLNPRRCSSCGSSLGGPSSKSRLGKLTRTQRKVNRPYGGRVCHSCLRNFIKLASREGKQAYAKTK